MAKRKTKRKSYRRKNFNVLNFAQGVVVGNAVTQGFFGTNLMEFATGRINGSMDGGSSEQVTFPELIGLQRGKMQGFGGVASNYTKSGGGLSGVVQQNLTRGAPQMLATVFLAPIMFKFGKKAMRPLLTPIRGALKGTGVTV